MLAGMAWAELLQLAKERKNEKMKKMSLHKRLLSLFLVLFMLFTSVPVNASEAGNPVTGTEETGNSENHAPALNGEATETIYMSHYGTGGTTYKYFDPSAYFTDEDGDTLTYTVTKDGEKVEGNSTSSYQVVISQPGIQTYKIVANDGQADSQEKTLVYYAVKPSLELEEDCPLVQTGTTEYMYIYEEGNNTFKLPVKFEPAVDLDLTYQLPTWASEAQKNAVSINAETGEVTITKPETTLYNVTIYGMYGAETMASISLTIYPEKPAVSQDTYEVVLAENTDLRKAITVQNAFSNWYASGFSYEVENPEIADVTYSGSYNLAITPKKLGTTKVTATYEKDSSLKIEFNIIVKGVSVSIKETEGDSVFLKNGEEAEYQMLAEGTNDDETFTWASSDETIASIDEKGVLTAKKEGNVYITATSSLSTEENSLVGGMYVQVKEEGKVYLEEVSFENNTVFEGEEWSTKVSAFHPAQLTYDMQIKQNNISTTNLYFIPTFDEENLNAILSYQVNGGEYQTKALVNGEKVNISNAYMTGLNVITIAVSKKDAPENVTTYTFRVTRPYYDTSAISSLTLCPNGETAIAYPKYNNAVEGTLFRVNDDGSLGSTSFTSSHYQYKAFVFGKRTSNITLTARFQNANQYAKLLTNGKNPKDVVYNQATAPLTLDEDGTTEFTYAVVSEKTYVEKTAAEKDPFEEPETTYTITVENVEPLGMDAQIFSAEFATGEYYKPGFASNVYSYNVLLPNGVTTDTLTFTVPAGINVYKGDVAEANLLTTESQDEAGNPVYTTEVSDTTVTINLESVSTEDSSVTAVSTYNFALKERGTKNVVPDRVTEYLCLGSQYTNGSAYGMQPERTLLANSSIVSLGNFGGYIVYAYDTPIKNDEKNPYGIDFTVYGNSFAASAGAAEPGNVLVSEDGEKWYTLAGSLHYSDEATWDYSMTYTKNATGTSSWTASDGRTGTNYNYPVAKNYPYFAWNEENQSALTVTGVNLSSTAKDAYGSASAVFPAFGYVDVNPVGTTDGTAGNPYTGSHQKIGDGFDLDWAVDTNGMPVELEEISYIKISTASNIYAGAIGEKSPEVKTVCRTTNPAETSVGKTEAPTSIKINGVEVEKKEGTKNIFTASYDAETQLEVSVDVPEETNVYVNDTYGTTVNFETVPEKKLLRVIAQKGEQAPYIAIIELAEKEEEKPVTGTVIDISNIQFTDIAAEDIKGYVKVSFADNGIRNDTDTMDGIYRTPLGDFIGPVEVPFAEGENIPDVTLRLLNALKIDCTYSGTADDGFYMQGIGNFIVNDVYYESLGEFDAGSQSGWMITLNNWFTDKGASAFTVENGDVIEWLYSCSYGTDIGNDWMNASAEITGVEFKENYGTLSPGFDTEVAEYTYTVDNFEGKLALEILLENYSSVISCTVDGKTITYRPMQEIAVKNGSVIRITSAYPWAEGETDTIQILVSTGEEIYEEDAYAREVYATTGTYLEALAKSKIPTVSATGGEWMVLGLARSGKAVPEGYYTNVAKYVKANINAAGQLHRSKSTENSRVILALTAAGYNVTNVEGYNLLNGLGDMEYLKKQGINGPIWALAALDSHNYANPSQTVTRELLVDEILAAQLADGGWAISGTAADPDMTGMAITALVPYYKTDVEVKTAVDKALEKLSAIQLADGGFAAAGSDMASCESSAQVIVALTALGINPDADTRFIKNDKSVLDALLSFAVADGGFKHNLSGERDGMATEQGYYALAAYVRLLEEKTSLYDMSDVTVREENPTVEAAPTEKPGDSGTETPGNGTSEGNTSAGGTTPGDTTGSTSTDKQPENNNSSDVEIKKGQTYTVDGNIYKVTGSSTVSFNGLKKKTTKKVTIPKTVKIKGKTFKVTAIADKALKGKKQVTSVTIGANVKTIGASAFKGCKKLSKVTIGSGVTSIGKEAFRDCKKLNKITIKSEKLKKVGKNALKGIKSNAKIKVPSKKLSAYKKLLKNKGQSKKVNITK